MNHRYHTTMTDAEVREALHDWLQANRYPTHTLGQIVYFSHDLLTGVTTVETAFPLPRDENDFEGAAV